MWSKICQRGHVPPIYRCPKVIKITSPSENLCPSAAQGLRSAWMAGALPWRELACGPFWPGPTVRLRRRLDFVLLAMPSPCKLTGARTMQEHLPDVTLGGNPERTCTAPPCIRATWPPALVRGGEADRLCPQRLIAERDGAGLYPDLGVEPAGRELVPATKQDHGSDGDGFSYRHRRPPVSDKQGP